MIGVRTRTVGYLTPGVINVSGRISGRCPQAVIWKYRKPFLIFWLTLLYIFLYRWSYSFPILRSRGTTLLGVYL
jgi:hypothetical protein